MRTYVAGPVQTTSSRPLQAASRELTAARHELAAGHFGYGDEDGSMTVAEQTHLWSAVAHVRSASQLIAQSGTTALSPAARKRLARETSVVAHDLQRSTGSVLINNRPFAHAHRLDVDIAASIQLLKAYGST